MKRYALCLVSVLCSLLSVAQKNVVDEVVWIVGDEAILRSDIEKRRLDYGSQIKGNPYCVIPEQLAIQKLFLHQAIIDSINVTDAEVSQYVENDINQKIMVAGSKEKLEEYMKMPLVQIREELFDQYRNEATAMRMRDQLTSSIKVTPAEVRRYFKDLPEDSLPLIPTQVEVQLLVLQPRIPQAEIDRVKALLREYADRVNSGTTSFATLARLYSEDPGSARQGGEMPYMGKGELDPGFANVAFSLTDPKKVSKIAQSEFGFHIIQLIDKRGGKLEVPPHPEAPRGGTGRHRQRPGHPGLHHQGHQERKDILRGCRPLCFGRQGHTQQPRHPVQPEGDGRDHHALRDERALSPLARAGPCDRPPGSRRNIEALHDAQQKGHDHLRHRPPQKPYHDTPRKRHRGLSGAEQRREAEKG